MKIKRAIYVLFLLAIVFSTTSCITYMILSDISKENESKAASVNYDFASLFDEETFVYEGVSRPYYQVSVSQYNFLNSTKFLEWTAANGYFIEPLSTKSISYASSDDEPAYGYVRTDVFNEGISEYGYHYDIFFDRDLYYCVIANAISEYLGFEPVYVEEDYTPHRSTVPQYSNYDICFNVGANGYHLFYNNRYTVRGAELSSCKFDYSQDENYIGTRNIAYLELKRYAFEQFDGLYKIPSLTNTKEAEIPEVVLTGR